MHKVHMKQEEIQTKIMKCKWILKVKDIPMYPKNQ